MLKTLAKPLLLVFSVVLLSRLFQMLILPLTDTTEARYAEIARIMMETGDWITPYFDYNIPFWGKPPLSFWMEALSFNLFGVHEFSPRLPSWIATVLTTGLIYHFLASVTDKLTGLWASLIFSSFALVYILSGAVITDPFLVLGTNLSMISFAMTLKDKPSYWGYLFFVGISIGLLSKGPIALVLIGGAMGLWLLFSPSRWRSLKSIPWVSGSILTAVLTLPWYIAAEMKTPGFLEYFILGEHFYRFIDSGWDGDLYGNAHDRPNGMIWLLWLQASFPWGIVALLVILKQMLDQQKRSALWQVLTREDISYYVIWALFPMAFFTLSGNILWTYILPGLPALAILLALYFKQAHCYSNKRYQGLLYCCVLVVPLSITVFTFRVYQNDNMIRTEKYLVEYYDSVATEEEPLIFINKRPFSARYYSNGESQLVSHRAFKELLQKQQRQENSGLSYYIAVPKKRVSSVKKMVHFPIDELYSNKRYELYKIPY